MCRHRKLFPGAEWEVFVMPAKGAVVALRVVLLVYRGGWHRQRELFDDVGESDARAARARHGRVLLVVAAEAEAFKMPAKITRHRPRGLRVRHIVVAKAFSGPAVVELEPPHVRHGLQQRCLGDRKPEAVVPADRIFFNSITSSV